MTVKNLRKQFAFLAILGYRDTRPFKAGAWRQPSFLYKLACDKTIAIQQ